MLDQGRKFGKHPVERVVAIHHDVEQPISRIDGARQVLALLVELVGEDVEPTEEVADLLGPSRQQVVDLSLNHLEVRDAAAGEDGGDARQHSLGGRERRGVLQWDRIAVAQLLR